MLATAILAYIVYDIYRREFCRRVRFNDDVEYNEYDRDEPIDTSTIDASFAEGFDDGFDDSFIVIDEEQPLVPHRIYMKLQHGSESYVVYAELRSNRELADMFLKMLDSSKYEEMHTTGMRRGAWLRFGNKHAKSNMFGSTSRRERLPNARGTIAVVPNSSEFVLNVGPNAGFDGRAFPIGVVTHGMDFLDRICREECRNDVPMTLTTIESAGRL